MPIAIVVAAERDDLPDLDELGRELVRLRHRRRDLERLLERHVQRATAFPSAFASARQVALEGQLSEMDARIIELEAALLPLRRRDDS
jgi:hypothetical protein